MSGVALFLRPCLSLSLRLPLGGFTLALRFGLLLALAICLGLRLQLGLPLGFGLARLFCLLARVDLLGLSARLRLAGLLLGCDNGLPLAFCLGLPRLFGALAGIGVAHELLARFLLGLGR